MGLVTCYKWGKTVQAATCKTLVYQGIFADSYLPGGWKLRLGPQGTAKAVQKQFFSLEGSLQRLC